MASCMSLAATVLSTPPLTAPMTRPVDPHIARMRAISLPMNSSWRTVGKKMISNSPTHHSPMLAAPADAQHKPANYLLAARRVGDLGVELDAVEGLGGVCEGGVGGGRGVADYVKVGGRGGELVAVGHPDLRKGELGNRDT